MIILNNPITLVNSCERCHVHSNGWCRLYDGWQLLWHVAHSELSSEWPFISQQIWIQTLIAHEILGIWIMFEKPSAAKQSVYIHISRWHTYSFGILGSLTVVRLHRGRSGPRWRRSRWWCTWAYATAASVWILSCVSVARKAAILSCFMNLCRVTFHCSLHLVMPGRHNSPRHFIFYIGVRLLR